MATKSTRELGPKLRFGVWLPIGTAALLGATMVFILPQVFRAPEGSSRATRLADMARVLPATVTWCRTGMVLVVSLLLAACASLVAMSTALRDRPRARVSVLAMFALLAGGYLLYDVFWREERAAALRVFFDLLGDGNERFSGVYSGARVMGGLGASVSILTVGAAWALSSTIAKAFTAAAN